MQSVTSRIWTRVAVSISYDDNHYTTIYIRAYDEYDSQKSRHEKTLENYYNLKGKDIDVHLLSRGIILWIE